MRDSRCDVDRVPVLLAQLERRDDADAWQELGWRLVLDDDLVSPAGFAALPQLVSLAPRSAHARGLAGRILERAAGHHACDAQLADCAGTIAEFGKVLDRHLRSRPADYLVSFRALLAVAQEYHWANTLEGFTDDIYELACPHCGAEITIAIGGYGCYSQVWDGDKELQRELRPAVASELTGTGRWMHRIAVRDGQEVLADGIAHLFGAAECPVCASVFSVADEYTCANRPAVQLAMAEARPGVADAAQPRPEREPGPRDGEPRQDPGMPCDVCHHEMVRWTHRPNEAAEYWSCPWCYAVTSFDPPQFKLSRPCYMPPDLRWETASSELLWDASRHAYGYQRRTLCGIEKPDMSGSPYGMWGRRRDDCPDCTAMAETIDARWPVDRRDPAYRTSIRTDRSRAL